MNDEPRQGPSLAASYAGVAAVLVPFLGVLVWVLRRGAGAAVGEDLVAPILALVGLTFVVLVAAAVVRNVAVMRGTASPSYYVSYRDEPPSEVLERPARTYGNLLELPILFYLVCVLQMITEATDSVQVDLAWLFVAMRLLHAAAYIGFNSVPYRFALFFGGVITVATMWIRFAGAV